MNLDDAVGQAPSLPPNELSLDEGETGQDILLSERNPDALPVALLKSDFDKVVKKVPVKQEPESGGSEETIPQLREKVRGDLARRLVWLVIGTAAGAFTLAFTDHVVALIKDREPDRELSRHVISILLTSNAALTGAALGFYFGDKGGEQS